MNTVPHAKFALAGVLDERMAATARTGVVRVTVVACIAVVGCVASVTRLAILVRTFTLLVYFSGELVCRVLHLRKAVFCAQQPEGSHHRGRRTVAR